MSIDVLNQMGKEVDIEFVRIAVDVDVEKKGNDHAASFLDMALKPNCAANHRPVYFMRFCYRSCHH